jgi:hypothetical protein
MVSPTINYSYTPDRGWTWIETYFNGQFFTDNDRFFVNGAHTLAQNPIFRVEEHIRVHSLIANPLSTWPRQGCGTSPNDT